jgi:hypothetical protein
MRRQEGASVQAAGTEALGQASKSGWEAEVRRNSECLLGQICVYQSQGL